VFPVPECGACVFVIVVFTIGGYVIGVLAIGV
jgi:hypothetical protein